MLRISHERRMFTVFVFMEMCPFAGEIHCYRWFARRNVYWKTMTYRSNLRKWKPTATARHGGQLQNEPRSSHLAGVFRFVAPLDNCLQFIKGYTVSIRAVSQHDRIKNKYVMIYNNLPSIQYKFTCTFLLPVS